MSHHQQNLLKQNSCKLMKILTPTLSSATCFGSALLALALSTCVTDIIEPAQRLWLTLRVENSKRWDVGHAVAVVIAFNKAILR